MTEFDKIDEYKKEIETTKRLLDNYNISWKRRKDLNKHLKRLYKGLREYNRYI